MNEIKMDSSLKLKIQMDEEILCGQKINIKIVSKSDIDLKLSDLNIDVFISKDMFRFIKKNFKSDIFKVKVEKLDSNIIKINFKLKDQITLNKNQEEDLINFDLNVKKKISINESDIIFNVKIGENEEKFTKRVLVEDNSKKKSICKIKNINVESDFENQKIQFDENIKDYKITVPHDQQYLNVELCETFGDSEKIKSKCVKLKKAGSSTLIKAGDYKIEVCRLENPEKTKKSKKLKKSKKSKKTSTKEKKNSTKKNHKNKNMQSKIKNSNDMKEILDNDCDDDNDEVDVLNDSKDEGNNKISSVKEETINAGNNNNSKIIIGCCIISLILIGVCVFLWKKRKDKKDKN